MFSAVLKRIGYKPTITVLSVPVAYASLKNKDLDVSLGNLRIVQSGTGRDIVERPADDYVAEFVQHVNPRTTIKGSATLQGSQADRATVCQMRQPSQRGQKRG